MLQGQLVWQAGAWGVYREIRACCLLARLKLDEELQLGRVFFSWKAEIAAGAISLFHWHHPLVLQGPADSVPTLFLLEGGIMEGSLEDAPQLLVVLQVTSISHLWIWSWRWHELGSTCHAQ